MSRVIGADESIEMVQLLRLGLVTSRSSYTGSVFLVISGWIRIESVVQVIFDV